MNEIIAISWLFPLAYILGSIPTAVWVGKVFFSIDVREHGSGNAGATNVMRVLGVKTGIPVLLLDMLKGWFAVYLIHFQNKIAYGSEAWMILAITLGILAVLGHIYPVFAGFRGGKGVATIAGVCIALHPLATVSALGVFILVLVIWKYVSVGSISAGISFPAWVILIYHSQYLSLWIFSGVAASLLIYTHRTNIKRLIKGEEKVASFLFRKK
ncbi:glycerol-3-phosphate 1-O-acyltransferase PlsY [Bacteroidota bacterium]